MTPLKHPRLNAQIYREACEWFVECRTGDLDEVGRRELDRWLRKSPEHLGAYLEIAALWSAGPLLDKRNKWDAKRLAEQASVDADNVVSLGHPASPDDLEPHRHLAEGECLTVPRTGAHSWFGKGRMLAFSATVLVCLVLGSVLWLQPLRRTTYSTDVGEQRSIALTDGSTVDLNSRSQIRVRYSKTRREVDLLEGEALFHVARDRIRPFTVRSNTAQVRAVGTQFDVYRKREETLVSVVEGRVAVAAAAAGLGHRNGPSAASAPDGLGASTPADGRTAGDIYLGAGEQLRVTHEAISRPEHHDIANATAWRQRLLVFESASLSEVAEEFNRYNPRQLVIENAGLYDFHISGVFSSTDPTSLVRFLRQRPGVSVTETPAEIRVAISGAPQK